jgi:AcrR family transcriptional regulator
MAERETAPRGRHAPPLEVRKGHQRRRLFAAASAVFARSGYADATAESIAREAGMSKATFYEHFDNKEDCIVALFDAAADSVITSMRAAAVPPGDDSHGEDPQARYRAAIGALLATLAAYPDQAQTLLVEIIGAGPRAIERRDRALNTIADYIDSTNERDAARGLVPRLASPLDAFALVGAVVELASRQLRTRTPEQLSELEPVVQRLVIGILAASAQQAAS